MSTASDEDHAYRLGAKIRRVRQEKRITQARVSFETGIEVWRVSNIEHGRWSGRDDLAKRICEFLGINMEES